MKKRMILVALLMASTVAQPAYKCRDGSRTYYSDSPDCKGEVGDSVSAAPAGAGEAKSPIERGRLLCAGLPLDWIPQALETGESMEFRLVGGGEMVPIKYAGTHMSARRYSSGGEDGGCYTSIDGRRMLRSWDVEELK